MLMHNTVKSTVEKVQRPLESKNDWWTVCGAPLKSTAWADS